MSLAHPPGDSAGRRRRCGRDPDRRLPRRSGAGLGRRLAASAAGRRPRRERDAASPRTASRSSLAASTTGPARRWRATGQRRRLGSGAARSRRDPGRGHQHDPHDGAPPRGPTPSRSGSSRRSSRRPGSTIRPASAGVLRFAEELQKRGLYGIYMLSNFWQWSGGFAQYVSWAGGGPIPYPPPAPGGSWDRFQNFTGGFYKNAEGDGAVRRLRQVHGPAAEVEPDGDLGAGQRAARHDQHPGRFTIGSTRRRASSSRWRPGSW